MSLCRYKSSPPLEYELTASVKIPVCENIGDKFKYCQWKEYRD